MRATPHGPPAPGPSPTAQTHGGEEHGEDVDGGFQEVVAAHGDGHGRHEHDVAEAEQQRGEELEAVGERLGVVRAAPAVPACGQESGCHHAAPTGGGGGNPLPATLGGAGRGGQGGYLTGFALAGGVQVVVGAQQLALPVDAAVVDAGREVGAQVDLGRHVGAGLEPAPGVGGKWGQQAPTVPLRQLPSLPHPYCHAARCAPRAQGAYMAPFARTSTNPRCAHTPNPHRDTGVAGLGAEP